jgi:PadR family transcriptional regulator PadR
MAKKPDLLPGTLDMLILKTLTRTPLHGYGIALSIKHLSDHVLTVEKGSLYPALQRVLLQGLGEGRVEDDGDQPARALLYAHFGWA